MKQPESMEELIYMTRRAVDDGKVMAWVFKEECPNCKKALMGKPKDEKTGKAKIRAKEYVCPECNHSIEKTEYEETLNCNISYTCSECKKSGEVQVPFKRKSYKGTKAVIFNCEHCDAKIAVTKKMKGLKS